MIELPEGLVLAKQLNETICGKVIKKVTANNNPHKFAWFHDDPILYNDFLKGKIIGHAKSFGGKVVIEAENMRIAYAEGISLRHLKPTDKLPKKHQLLVEFEDASMLVASVQMYGGMWVFIEGEFDNKYHLFAQSTPSPISDEFNIKYYSSLISKEDVQKLSVKAFLATEQRIPGLGNGVLQDILLNAKIHPKRKINSLSDEEKINLLNSIKSTLNEMVLLGGRDTQKDLFGNSGGYKTKASKNTVGNKCTLCNSSIVKESYMGGSIYYCTGCQSI